LHFDRQSCRYGETPPVNVSGGGGNKNDGPPPAIPWSSAPPRYYPKKVDDAPQGELKDWFTDYVQK
jgi:hypothetical protein